MISFLTDFGLQDEYAGVMKGVALSIHPEARIVDISHGVAPGDVLGGAILLAASYPYFPAGTVHVAVVDPGVGSARKILAAAMAGSIFLAPDNGLLSMVFDREQITSLVSVENSAYFLKNPSATFHGRDIFASVAAHISLGLPISRLGPSLDPRMAARLDMCAPARAENGDFCGQVLAADRFGNLMTNICENVFQEILTTYKGRLEILVAGKALSGVYKTYAEAPDQALIALVGSRGYLEIAVAGGSAGEVLGASRGTKVLIRQAKA